MHIKSNLVDIPARRIYPASLTVSNGRITEITELPPGSSVPDNYLLPGFIDAHVHIESSMLVPTAFARLAVVHGTVATVSDPHEIANVCGLPGVDFMIENGRQSPFKFYFGAPSCVPATTFETAGAALHATDIAALLARPEIKYLSEMMNFPGVLHGDPEVMAKIAAAQAMDKPIDGHAPGLRGADAKRYIEGGVSTDGKVVISTDHECFTAAEALDKLNLGMKILIREGSAARNFEALADLLRDHSKQMMFCSDDKHPDSLVAGHINSLCARAVAKGIDLFNVLQAACINPVEHYKLDVGLLRVGDPADFIIVRELNRFEVLETVIDGERVAENGKSLIPAAGRIPDPINQFQCSLRQRSDFHYDNHQLPVIEALDGQIVTGKRPGSHDMRDTLKIVVVNRYHNAPVSKAFIANFGLKRGAIASSVAHDSHNIVAVGADDDSICRAVNAVINSRGGISCVSDELEMILPLPVAGLMSSEDGYDVATAYTAIDAAAKSLGSTLGAPFMTLSFMALLVIPHLKLSDLGLFDGDSFSLIA